MRHEKYIDRATTSTADDVDLLAINLFATIVQQNETSMAYEATKIILRKFNSTNDDEVLLALNVILFFLHIQQQQNSRDVEIVMRIFCAQMLHF